MIRKAERRIAIRAIRMMAVTLAAMTVTIGTEARDLRLADASGNILIEGAATVFTCNHHSYSTRSMSPQRESDEAVRSTMGSGTRHTQTYRSADGLLFGVEVTTYSHAGWVTLCGWVKNTTHERISFDDVALIDGGEGPLMRGDWRHTRAMCGASIVWLDDAARSESKDVNARSFLCLRNSDSREEYTLGFSIRQAWGSFAYHLDGDKPRFTARVTMDVDMRPGETRHAEAMHIKRGKVWGDYQDLIAATGREVGAKTDGPSMSGWCSWYGFNPFIDNDVTEDVVTDVARGIGRMKDLPLHLMILDDGYFTLPGDWTSIRPFFPHGMKHVADVCRHNGLIPGIWVGPVLGHEHSRLVADHPEWVDRDKDGKCHLSMGNWGGHTWSLDASNPVFLHHLDTLFRTITHRWGFRYLKLDFNADPGSNRSDRSITSFQAMRRMYHVIRQACGDSVFIANCYGGPYPPCIGEVMAGRVGPDVNPGWSSVLEGCRNSLFHLPFHRRWWVNDPDCLNMREKRTSLTEDELRTHLTANFMGGGYVLFSDSIEELSPSRHRMLAQALPPAGESAEIADFMTCPASGAPSLLYYPVERWGEKSSIVTLFNWSDTLLRRAISMDEVGLSGGQDYYVYDFWTDTYRGILRDSIPVDSLKPHHCSVMAVRPVVAGQIQVISTTFHLLQGAREITDVKRMVTSPFDGAKAEMWLSLTPLSLREGKVVLASPDGLRIAAVQGARARLSHRSDGLWDLTLSAMSDRVAILLRVR